MKRPIAVLKLTRRIGDDIVYAASVHDRMTQSPWFPKPPVPLAVFARHIADAREAAAAALTRARALVTEQRAKLAIVRVDLGHLRNYVQFVADANLPSAAAIIESAGMSVKNARGRGKNRFLVVAGPVPGSVILTMEWGGDRASYEAEWSLDQESWTSVGNVLQSKRVMRGLPSRRRLFFRARSVIQGGRGDWTDVVSVIVQ
jgi:hypothetical protein